MADGEFSWYTGCRPSAAFAGTKVQFCSRRRAGEMGMGDILLLAWVCGDCIPGVPFAVEADTPFYRTRRDIYCRPFFRGTAIPFSSSAPL